MENKITIEIGENKLGKIKIKTDQGIETKYVAIEDIANMFIGANTLENEKEKEIFVKSPILPQFQDIFTVQYMESENNTQVYVLKKESTQMDLTYYGDKYTNVGIPTLLFKIKVSNNSIKQIQIVAIKDKIIREDTELFKYPFSNVFENTNVCLGPNNIAALDINDTATIHRIPNLVLTLDNNNDAYHSANNTGLPLRELLAKLSNKKFDEGILNPLNKTYKQWIEQ